MEVDLNVVQNMSTEYAEGKKLAIGGILFSFTKFSRKCNNQQYFRTFNSMT